MICRLYSKGLFKSPEAPISLERSVAVVDATAANELKSHQLKDNRAQILKTFWECGLHRNMRSYRKSSHTVVGWPENQFANKDKAEDLVRTAS